MLKIGITGGIGSGKSVVSKIIESLGYPVFNSDSVAKELITQDSELKNELIELVGTEAFTDGMLNREFLAEKLFGNDELREKINSLVHPKVRSAFDLFVNDQNASLIFNEAAILFETGNYKAMDGNILIIAPEEIRLERVVKRDNIKEGDVLGRMKKQWSDEEKLKLADYVIINDERQPLIIQIEKTISDLIN